MVNKKDKMKPRTKSKQQKGLLTRIFWKIFPCIAPPNENPKQASRRSRRIPELPPTVKKKTEKLRDRVVDPAKNPSSRGLSKGYKEGPRRRAVLESTSQQPSGRRHGLRLESESHRMLPAPTTIPLLVPYTQALGYLAEGSSPHVRCTSSEICQNNDFAAAQYASLQSHYAHPPITEIDGTFQSAQAWSLPADGVHMVTPEPNTLAYNFPMCSRNAVSLENEDTVGLGIQNVSIPDVLCENSVSQTPTNEGRFTMPDFLGRPLSRASTATSDTGATIGRGVERRCGSIPPGFNSIPRWRQSPPTAPDPNFRPPCVAPMPPGSGYDSDSSSTYSNRTTNKSATSSASSLPKEPHSSYPYGFYPGVLPTDTSYVGSSRPVEPGGIAAWPYSTPIPALMLTSLFTPPPSSHTLAVNGSQSGFNDMRTNQEEPKVYPAYPYPTYPTYPTRPRRNGARRKRERRAMNVAGNVKRDIRVTVSGGKQPNRKKNTMTLITRGMEVSVQRNPDIGPAQSPGAKPRRRRSWKEMDVMRFGGIRAGKESLSLEAEEGSVRRDSTSYQYGKAGRSQRTRAEMQPTVESVPTSVVGYKSGA